MACIKFSILSLLLLLPAIEGSYEAGRLQRLRKDTRSLKGVRGAKRGLVEGNETSAEIQANGTSTAIPALIVSEDGQQLFEEGDGEKGATKKGSDKQAVAGSTTEKGANKKGSDKQAVAGDSAEKGANKKGSNKQAVAGTNVGKDSGSGKANGKAKNDKQGVSDDGGAPKASKGEPKAARDTEPKKGAGKSMDGIQSVAKGEPKAAKDSKDSKGAGKRDSEPKKGAGKSVDGIQSVAKGEPKVAKDSKDNKGAGKRDSEPKKGAGKSVDDVQSIAKGEPKAAKDSDDGKGAGKRTGDIKSAAKGTGKTKGKSTEAKGDSFPTEGSEDELVMDENKGAGKNKGEAKAVAVNGKGKSSREEVMASEDEEVANSIEAAESTEELQEEFAAAMEVDSKKKAKGTTGASRRIRGRH